MTKLKLLRRTWIQFDSKRVMISKSCSLPPYQLVCIPPLYFLKDIRYFPNDYNSMDCKYVRESNCLTFCFHPHASSLFYLTNTKSRLRVIEENLYTGLVVNQLAVPLKQQNLNVDNYILNYCPEGKFIVLTLSNHVLIFSLEFKSLLFIGEAQHSKVPCFIERAVIHKNILYFSATDHHQLFALTIKQCVQSRAMPAFTRFKLPPEVLSIGHSVSNSRLVAICNDNNMRVWDCDSGAALKGVVLDRSGEPTCLTFSKDGEYLLIGTSTGTVQVWDGATLGVNNTLVLTKAVCKQYIQSLAWFHYSGESQSRRFLMFTRDGNVKLFSFYFQRVKEGKQKWMGKTNELLLLFINKCRINQNFEIKSHEFANFIYFHPGVLLYLVDYFPRMYFPVIAPQLVPSFESLVPNARKEIFWQPNFFYVDGLILKRLRHEPENKLALTSVLEYEGLKILKMDYRPKFNTLDVLPMKIQKGVPSHPIRYKFLINYYLGNMIRSLVLSDVPLAGSNDNIESFREYSSQAALFLGPQRNLEPLLLLLLEDKQTVTVVSEHIAADLQNYTEQQRVYLSKAGEVYSRQLKVKVQKIFETPFRNQYVILYLCDNLIRFSNNIHIHADLMDYEVYQSLGLRLDYTDIVIDVVWTSRGQLGCVVCLEKAVFINDQLKVQRTVPIEGYVVQGQFVGYTLIVTTKVDVQYIDISGKALQLYCIENYQSRYLILGILTDRIIGIERFQGAINCKVRYFNLMQPLLAGYLNYYTQIGAPINGQVMKSIIEGYAPYHAVSQEFLQLLNRSGWSNFGRYFIESHVKLYSRSIRAANLNSEVHIERFINPKVWLQHGKKILDYLLYYEELHNSSDQYEIQKSREYESLLIALISTSFESIKQALAEEQARASSRLSIAANFGEQSQFQVFYDYSDKQNIFVKMELLPFRASDDREWIGINSVFLESKIGENDNDLDINAVQEEKDEQEHQEHASDEEGGEFKDLIAYYRFDDGKGDLVDDLSDYNNEGTLYCDGESWRPLDEEPMEIEDKWGKKCPPQYAVRGTVRRQKRLGGRAFKNFTFQLWFYSQSSSFILGQIGENFTLGLENNQFYMKTSKMMIIERNLQGAEYNSASWTNLSFAYTKQSNEWILYLNGSAFAKGKNEIRLGRDLLELGDKNGNVQFTEFRLWRKSLTAEVIKEYLRSPLEIVAEKRKKLKMRIKEKKKKEKAEGQGNFFPSFPF